MTPLEEVVAAGIVYGFLAAFAVIGLVALACMGHHVVMAWNAWFSNDPKRNKQELFLAGFYGVIFIIFDYGLRLLLSNLGSM